MICIAISEKDPDLCLQILDKVELAEIRIDMTGYDVETVQKVFAHPTPTVATCRADVTGPEHQLELLRTAIQAGAKYVDIEIEAGKKQIDRIAEICRKNDCKLIVSYHNYELTPALNELKKIIEDCYALGADVAKIATQVNDTKDNACLLSLYSLDKPMVILGMGEKGMFTRIAAPFMGAEFSFAAMDDGRITAPGQISYSEMKALTDKIRDSLKQD
jgi:3-dehydroquinate dehydratase type I